MSYETISGVMMHIGNYDIADYPGRTQREVHADRRHESITYKIEPNDPDYGSVDGWVYYSYKFTYRYLGRVMTINFQCGLMYGEPNPWDGLHAAFRDADSVQWEEFGPDWMEEYGFDHEKDYKKAEKVYKQCEKQVERLDKFFGKSYQDTAWYAVSTQEKFN